MPIEGGGFHTTRDDFDMLSSPLASPQTTDRSGHHHQQQQAGGIRLKYVPISQHSESRYKGFKSGQSVRVSPTNFMQRRSRQTEGRRSN